MRTLWFTMCFCVSSVFAGEGEPVHHSFRYHSSYGSPQTLHALTFSPDGRQLAISISDHVDFIDTQEGEILYQFRASPFSMRFTRDGQRLYMISTDEARLLEVKSGVVIPAQYMPVMGSLGIDLEERNGKLLIRSLLSGGSAEASDVLRSGDELVAFGEGQNEPMLRITGSKVKSISELMQGFVGTYARLTFLPRGKFGAKNEQTVVLRRYAATGNGKGLAAPRRTTVPESLVWCIVGGHWHEFRDAASGHPVAHLETIDIHNIGLYALSPDQTKFAVVARKKEGEGNAVEVFDLATQSRLALIPLAKSSFYDIAFAADNNRVLVGTWDTVEIADTAESMVVSQMTLGYQLPQKTDSYQGSASIGSLAMNSVRAGVASGLPSHDGSPQQLLAKLAVSTHNVVAVGDMGGNIGLWDLNSGKHLKKITLEQEAAVADLQFSPDGKWLAYYVAATLHIEDVSDFVSSHGPISESLTSVEASTISSADPTE